MIEQDTNRENLKKLLDFLKNRILRIPENQWFANELHRILAPTSDARISDIHELCVENIIESQAAEFYKDFVIDELRPQLIADFIKMEHWRRRNDIQEFCMALYQQIEAITNYLGRDDTLNLIWRNIRDAGFFVDFMHNDIRIRFKSKSINDSIIYKPDKYRKNGRIFTPELSELVAMDKFKAILFLIVYQTNVTLNSKRSFNDDFFTGQDIYHIRNLNHRGNLSEPREEKPHSILGNPVYSMLSLLGFFARFVAGINEGYPVTKELVEFAEVCCKSKPGAG